MAQRRTTPGRPPNADNIGFDADCINWFNDPSTNPRNPDLNMSASYLKRYTEVCFLRLMAHLYPGQDINSIPSDTIKNRIAEYFGEQPAILAIFNDYIGQRIPGTAAIPVPPQPSMPRAPPIRRRATTAATKEIQPIEVLPIFAPIKSILQDYKPYKIKTGQTIKYDLKPDIILANNALTKEWEKIPLGKTLTVNLTLVMQVLIQLIQKILSMELDPSKLNARYIQSLYTGFQTWRVTYPRQLGYRFRSTDDYMSVYIDALEIYMAYRLNHSIYFGERSQNLTPYTPAKMNALIIEIKRKLVASFGLEKQFNFPNQQAEMIRLLNTYVTKDKFSREQYQYIWLFITEKVTFDMDSTKVNEAERETQCEMITVGMHSNYSPFSNYLVDKCSLLKRNTCPLVNRLRTDLVATIKEEYPYYTPGFAWEDKNEYYIKCVIERKNSLADFFKIWYVWCIIEKKAAAEFWMSYFDVTFNGEQGHFVGVQTDLLQTCLDQLVNPAYTNVLIPSEEGSSRFQFNHSYKCSAEFIQALNGFVEVKEGQFRLEDKYRFVEFIGGLFSRCFLMGIELPVKLSYYTMSYLYNGAQEASNMDQKSFGLYFLMDMPSRAGPLINLLKEDPDSLEYTYLEFNDQYPLLEDKKNKAVTKENVVEFINRTGMYVLNTINMNNIHAFTPEKRAQYKSYREIYRSLLYHFKKGFLINFRGVFSDEQIAINIMDSTLNRGGIQKAHVDEIFKKKNMHVVYSEIEDEMTEAEKAVATRNNEHQKKIIQWFSTLLRKPNELKTKIPYDIFLTKDKIPKNETQRKDVYYNSFLPHLIYFWTGSRSINPNVVHQIHFINNDPSNATSDAEKQRLNNTFPISHTCFKYLDLPTYNQHKVNGEWDDTHWEDELMRKITYAIYETQGFGLAGGRRRPSRQALDMAKCIEHVNKKCSIENSYNEAFACAYVYTMECEKRLTPVQKKKLIAYLKNHAIDFEHRTAAEMSEWTKGMIEYIGKGK